MKDTDNVESDDEKLMVEADSSGIEEQDDLNLRDVTEKHEVETDEEGLWEVEGSEEKNENVETVAIRDI